MKTKERLTRTIDEQKGLDDVARTVQRPLHRLLEPRPRLQNFLHGAWLGHPLHAALTDIPVGAFSVGFLLDARERLGGHRSLQRAADASITIGILGALAAALPGAADWSSVEGPARKVGLLHGLANLAVVGLYGGSLLARRRRRRALGVGLSSSGYLLLLCSAWLGGELSYRYGVGARRPERPVGETRGQATEIEGPPAYPSE